MVKDLEGLYSSVLTIHMFIYDNLLEESLNLIGRKSYSTGYVINKYGFITDSRSVNTVGSMIQSYIPIYKTFLHLNISGIFCSNNDAFEDKMAVISILFSSFCYKNNRVCRGQRELSLQIWVFLHFHNIFSVLYSIIMYIEGVMLMLI